MERDFHHWLQQHCPPTGDQIIVGIGDDAAIVDFGGPTVITSDSIADKVHFDSSVHSLKQIGHKAIAVSLSDIAAMGSRPIAASVDLFIPRRLEFEDLKRLFESLASTAKKYHCQIVGGDTNRWDGPLVLSTNVYGVAAVQSGHAWLMSNAKPDDLICVTGPLGGSLLGKHIAFEPRLDLAIRLAENYNISAATDITDSLAIDLKSLATASGCGFVIDAADVPVSDAAREMAKTNGSVPLDHALYDGEDFELILCLSETEFEKIKLDKDFGQPIYRIGTMSHEERFLINRDGSKTKLEIRGYEH